MSLREAYQTIIKDILLNRELGTEKVITPKLAEKITERLQNDDDFLIRMEESITDTIVEALDDYNDEYDLF